MVDQAEIDYDFEKADSGASKSVPLCLTELRKGMHILMGEGRPCKVIEIATSKTGKHGHAKAAIVGVDIFNARKYQDVSPLSHSKEAPLITRREYTLMDIDDEGYLSLCDKAGIMRSDLKFVIDIEWDTEVKNRITKGFEEGKSMVVTVLASMDIEKIEEGKEAQLQ